MSRVRDTLLTLTPNRLLAVARTYGVSVEDTRVHESVAEALEQAIRNGSLSIPRVLEECDGEDLLRMRLTAGLADEDLRETVPELLRNKIGLRLEEPAPNRSFDREAVRGRGPRPTGSTPRHRRTSPSLASVRFASLRIRGSTTRRSSHRRHERSSWRWPRTS